jgi:hypothetical protein
MFSNILHPRPKPIRLCYPQRRAARRDLVARSASHAVHNPNVRKTFAQGLCERFGCSPEEYLRVALKHCLHLQAQVWFSLFPSGVRAADVQLLEDTGAATTTRELRELLQEYCYRLELSGGFAAKRLKIRISCERLQRLWKRAMCGESERLGA